MRLCSIKPLKEYGRKINASSINFENGFRAQQMLERKQCHLWILSGLTSRRRGRVRELGHRFSGCCPPLTSLEASKANLEASKANLDASRTSSEASNAKLKVVKMSLMNWRCRTPSPEPRQSPSSWLISQHILECFREKLRIIDESIS